MFYYDSMHRLISWIVLSFGFISDSFLCLYFWLCGQLDKSLLGVQFSYELIRSSCCASRVRVFISNAVQFSYELMSSSCCASRVHVFISNAVQFSYELIRSSCCASRVHIFISNGAGKSQVRHPRDVDKKFCMSWRRRTRCCKDAWRCHCQARGQA